MEIQQEREGGDSSTSREVELGALQTSLEESGLDPPLRMSISQSSRDLFGTSSTQYDRLHKYDYKSSSPDGIPMSPRRLLLFRREKELGRSTFASYSVSVASPVCLTWLFFRFFSFPWSLPLFPRYPDHWSQVRRLCKRIFWMPIPNFSNTLTVTWMHASVSMSRSFHRCCLGFSMILSQECMCVLYLPHLEGKKRGKIHD